MLLDLLRAVTYIMGVAAQTKLSLEQRRTLAALARTVEGGLPLCFLYAPVFAVRPPRPSIPRIKQPPVPAVIQASLWRTLTRLVARGLVRRPHRGYYVITNEGRAIARARDFEPARLELLPRCVREFWFVDATG